MIQSKKIINRWAPPVENATNRYIEYVEAKTGINKNTKLSARHYYWVVRAIALMEGMIKNDHDAVTAAYDEVYNELKLITKNKEK